MEEEVAKRLTDCVYFLASPLTCKKGIECEYRHNEIARLNPRDCWYWLAGSCLNPSCAFRHPPLDIHNELSKHAPSQAQLSTSTKKIEVPCYFYFSGFCKKGDNCSFLHGPNDASKVLKTAPAISDLPQLENKTSAGSNAVPVAIKTLPMSSGAALKVSAGTQVLPKKGVNPPEFEGPSVSPHTSTFKFEEASVARLGTLPDREGSVQREYVIYTDQSSEELVELVEDHLREDDWLESSPGIDVLVDDRYHNMGFEDYADRLEGIEGDVDEANDHFLGYDYKDCIEYAGTLREEQRIDSCVDLDDDIDEEGYPVLRRSSPYDDEKMHPTSIRERKFLPVRLPIDGCRGVDLQSRLRRRRATDNRRLPCFSERNNPCLKINRNHEKSRQCGRFRANNYSGQFKKSHPNMPRQHYKEMWQSKRPSSYDISRRPVLRRIVNEEYFAFSGPKTLDQIKDEKRKRSENVDSYCNLGRLSKKFEDFQGPKPLSEILKDKRKLHSVMDVNNGI